MMTFSTKWISFKGVFRTASSLLLIIIPAQEEVPIKIAVSSISVSAVGAAAAASLVERGPVWGVVVGCEHRVAPTVLLKHVHLRLRLLLLLSLLLQLVATTRSQSHLSYQS
jgi:hypothetical protein